MSANNVKYPLDEIIDIKNLVIKTQKSFIVKFPVLSAAAIPSPHSSLLVVNNNADGADKAQKASLALACIGLTILSINLCVMVFRFFVPKRSHQEATHLEQNEGRRVYYLFLDEHFKTYFDELKDGNVEARFQNTLKLVAPGGQCRFDCDSR